MVLGKCGPRGRILPENSPGQLFDDGKGQNLLADPDLDPTGDRRLIDLRTGHFQSHEEARGDAEPVEIPRGQVRNLGPLA